MAKLSVDKALLKAKSHAKKGEIEEAQQLYQAVLQAFPKNKRAQQGLASSTKTIQPAVTQSPPQDTINHLINLYNQGKLKAVVEPAKALAEQYPDAFMIWNILGAANKGLGRVQAASEAFKKVTELNPTYADGYSNLGVTLQEQGQLDEAIASFNKALSLKPDYAEAYYNMGNAFQDQGKLEEAIASYEKALTLKPNYAEAYNNIIELLKLYSNVSSSMRGLIDIDRQSKEFGAKLLVSSTDQEIGAIVSETLGFINRAEFKFKTLESQLYKRNAVDLNCSRHMKIFDQKSIIPEFCFGCFKIQVEVNDLFSLIKLTKLFYDLNFETDLTRKTMIEMRPEIPGFYKGLFYCRGLKQARNVKETLDADLNFTFGGQIVSQIKRGCSEYPLKFPDYGKIKNDREVEMDFPIDWKLEEDQFDQDTLIKPKENLIPSRSEFCLSDFYIIQKWIDYSKGLNDPSSEWFEDQPIVFPNVYNIAVNRKTKFGKVF